MLPVTMHIFNKATSIREKQRVKTKPNVCHQWLSVLSVAVRAEWLDTIQHIHCLFGKGELSPFTSHSLAYYALNGLYSERIHTKPSWLISARGDNSISIPLMPATLPVFRKGERKNKDRACRKHSPFTGEKQRFLAGPLGLFLAAGYRSRAPATALTV